MPYPQFQRVSPEELRRMFNDYQFAERAAQGHLSEKVLKSSHPSAPLANEPICTHSQLVSYRDRFGREVARAHRYLRPDGSIGLSGRPDPKRIQIGNTLYCLSLP